MHRGMPKVQSTTHTFPSRLCVAISGFVLALLPSIGNAQSNIIRAIRSLDTNYNKYLEPHEITNRARPLLKKYAPYERIDMLRPNYLGRWEEAVYRYYERQRSGGRRVRPETPSPLQQFDLDRDAPVIPGFGLGDIKYPYSQRDLDEADDTLRRADRNNDGYVDRQESRRSEWTRTNPFGSDYNKDNRLSRIELAQRYAARRVLERGAERRHLEMRRERDGLSRYDRPQEGSRASQDRQVRTLSDGLLRRYDDNRNRKLEANELLSLRLDLRQVDLDRNDEVSRSELEDWIAREIEAKSESLTDSLPTWFFERDANGDGQIQMSEFADEWPKEKLQEFTKHDVNDDGVITARELGQTGADADGYFSNANAEILPPRSTIVSEIEVDDETTISDLNLELSITHTYVGHLDAYLIGPDGQRIELFTEIGRDGDHFEDTVFDDDSKTNINKARSPFRGHYQPEALAKKQPGLNHYRGKSAKGLWQLMIRSSRSERPGMMHRWALVVNSTSKSANERTPEKKDDENKEPPREESGSDGRKSDRRDSKSRKRRG